MLTEERHAFILQKLNENSIVKTQELMDLLHCSESTIRRDLDQLEKAGQLKRIHGGAKRVYHLDEELTYTEKSFKNIQEKTMIGKYAASLIQKNDVIYLDAGTTTLAMVDFLPSSHITIITNGILHASLLADKNIPTILVGGRIKPTTKAVVGATSLNELESYRFNKAFIGINGIDLKFGCTTPDTEEAAVKKLVLQQSALSYILADETKWNKVTFAKVCDLEDVTIITNTLNSNTKAYIDRTTVLEAKS